jgi:hypothetical protein
LGTEIDNGEALQLLRAHGRDIRAALASILATTDALRRTDSAHLDPIDRLPYLDAIWRDGSRVLDLVNRILTAQAAASKETVTVSPPPAIQTLDAAAGAAVMPAAPREIPARRGTAYLGWLRSRLAQIEQLAREGSREELGDLARQLKDSAAAMGFSEISEAASAVQRLSAAGTTLDAGVEILRRVVNRAIRSTSGAAA